jgi:hypothetical protein
MGHVFSESSPTLLADKVHVVGLLQSMIFFLCVAFGALDWMGLAICREA